MDQFIAWRSIYSSISDKEILDEKSHFFGTTCIGASAVGIGPFHLDPGEAVGPTRWTSLLHGVRFTAKFLTRKSWWIKMSFFGTTCIFPSKFFFSKYAFVTILRLIMLPVYHFDPFV